MNYLRLSQALATRPIIARYLLLPIAVVTLLFGLWPLGFRPENQVRWLGDGSGVEFYEGGDSGDVPGWGAIYSAGEMDVSSAAGVFQPATVEVYLEPHCDTSSGLTYILSFYSGSEPQSLVIAQWKTCLEILARDERQDSRQECRSIDIDDALRKGVKVLLTITSDKDRTDIFVNGAPTKSFLVDSLFGTAHFNGRLVLGNSPTGEHQWLGNLYGLALYGESLSPEQVRQSYLRWTSANEMPIELPWAPIVQYSFDEREGTSVVNRVGGKNRLTIPRIYTSLVPGILTPPWRGTQFDRGLVVDVTINLLGFVPFGLCMAGYLCEGKRLPYVWGLLIATLSGAFLSLTIELTQVALPGRSSSLLDLVCNTLGAGLGAAGAAVFHRLAAYQGQSSE